jgi:hypothetical protein
MLTGVNLWWRRWLLRTGRMKVKKVIKMTWQSPLHSRVSRQDPKTSFCFRSAERTACAASKRRTYNTMKSSTKSVQLWLFLTTACGRSRDWNSRHRQSAQDKRNRNISLAESFSVITLNGEREVYNRRMRKTLSKGPILVGSLLFLQLRLKTKIDPTSERMRVSYTRGEYRSKF